MFSVSRERIPENRDSLWNMDPERESIPPFTYFVCFSLCWRKSCGNRINYSI